MDTKKIFIILILFLFNINSSFATELTFDLKRGSITTISEDSKLDKLNLNFDDADKLKSFEYFLISKDINKTLKNTNWRDIPVKYDTSYILEIDNISEKNNFDNSLKNKYEKINIFEKEIQKLNYQMLEEKDFWYYWNREINKDYVSNWHFKEINKKIVLQKTLNIKVKKDHKMLFYYNLDDEVGPSKVNLVFELKGKFGSHKYVKEMYIAPHNEFIFSKDDINYATYGFPWTVVSDGIIEFEKYQVSLREVVLFFSIADLSRIRSLKYKIFQFPNKEYYIDLNDNKTIILPSNQNSLFEDLGIVKKIPDYVSNIFINLNGNRDRIYRYDQRYVITKSYWESTLLTLFKFLKEEKFNYGVYIQELGEENIEVIKNISAKTPFNFNYVLKLSLNTIIFIGVLMFLLSIKIKRITKNVLKSIIRFNLLILLIIFFGYHISDYFNLLTLEISLSGFGLIAFINTYLILIGKNNPA